MSFFPLVIYLARKKATDDLFQTLLQKSATSEGTLHFFTKSENYQNILVRNIFSSKVGASLNSLFLPLPSEVIL